MTSPLERLAGSGGSLFAEPFDQQEFDGLLRSATVRLKDAENSALSLASQFDLAYNAAHAFALAALRRRGYRAKNRYVVFQALPHTLRVGPDVWRVLAKCHERRNAAEYEGLPDVDQRIVADLVGACRAVATALTEAAARD